MTSWMDTPEEKRRMRAEMEVSAAIRRAVVEQDSDAFETRPLYPGANPDLWTGSHPKALPAITAARQLMHAAVSAERKAIEHARGQGKTWTEIGRALGKGFVEAAKREDMSLALAAWRYAAAGVLPNEKIPYRVFSYDGEYARWRCWTCTETIKESHPDNGSDRETGHGPGCSRSRRSSR